MSLAPRRGSIRRIALVVGLLAVAVAALPGATTAASPLALNRSDYPRGAKLAVVPATNAAADHYLAPAHHSTFEQLRRLDGAGWLQFATWSFKTGAGSATTHHETVFGYGINLFRRTQEARRALADVKLPTRPGKVAHLPARLFISSSADRTLLFAFLVYKSIEVEAYYEYAGVAPAALAKSLRHVFSRQLSHLVRVARTLSQKPATPTDVPATPTPTATEAPASTVTPVATTVPTVSSTATITPSILPTATATSLSTPTATSTPTMAPTATATPTVLTVQASMGNPTYAPGTAATVNVQVSANGQPVSGLLVHASFAFDVGPKSCDSRTDAGGMASCSVAVPKEPAGTTVRVSVQVVAPDGQSAFGSTSFTVSASS